MTEEPKRMAKMLPKDLDLLQDSKEEPEDFQIKREIKGLVSRMMAEIRRNLSAYHHMPAPLVHEGCIWLPTGKWVIYNIELDQFNLKLILAHIWTRTDGFRDYNPLKDEIGRPKNFGPGFELPRTLIVNFQHTKIVIAEARVVREYIKVLPHSSIPMLRQKLKEALYQLDDYITKLDK